MSYFNKRLKKYLTLYKTPIAPDQLDPNIFYFPQTGEPPKLHQGVHAHIINDMEMFSGGQSCRIKTCLIVGNAVTPGKKSLQGDIKVMIVLNKHLMDKDVDGLLAEEVLKLANALSNRYIIGTTRTIKYVPTVRDVEPADYPGIYDVPTQSWIKLPSGLSK